MGKTERRIVYKAGVTRTPSDFLCQDGELAECVNMATDGEELKTVPPLEPLFTFPPVPEHEEPPTSPYITAISRKLLYVHRFNGQERYIIWQQTTWSTGNIDRDIRWGTVANGQYEPAQEYFPPSTVGGLILPGFYQDYVLFDDPGTASVTSIGKTLVFTTEEGLKYAIWKNGVYDVYDKIPEPQFSAWMEYPPRGFGSRHVQSVGSSTDIIDTESTPISVAQDKRSAFDDLVVGLYSKNLKEVAQKKGFCQPFFVRVALKMVDDNYTLIGAPILLLPVVRHSTYYWMGAGTDDLYCDTCYSLLCCSQLTDYSDFSDIIKDVVLFITDGVHIYDTAKTDQTIEAITDGKVADGIYKTVNGNVYKTDVAPSRSTTCYRMIARREDSEINDDIKSQSVFYKLCEIGLHAVSEVNTREKISAHTLENITTQDQLPHDDYFSHCELTADMAYAYNSRLNLAGLHRGFFDGFDYFLPFDNTNESTYVALVRIKTDSGDRIVKKTFTTRQKQGLWFYYPDPRAEWVSIWKDMSGQQYSGQLLVLNSELTEHSGLNGAFYFWGMSHTFADTPPATVLLPDYVEGDNVDAANAIPYDTEPSTTPEDLPNQVATSEVDNPFVFLAKGYNRVGTGRIIAMTSQTHALSQGQFGRFPLIIFTDEGIWAMDVDKTGLYDSINPMPREVCTNARSIIQTDDHVLFVSKKGLMVIGGRDVTCASTAMNGRAFDTQAVDCLTERALDDNNNSRAWSSVVSAAADDGSFQSFLEGVLMAYDYIDRRMLLFHPSMAYCWAWSMKDGGFSKLLLPARITNVVNNYPDYLLQDSNRVYSLYGKRREEEITSRQRGFLLTRPLKLAGPVSVSSLRELVNVGFWNKDAGSTVRTEVLVSSDLQSWHLASSRFGAAAKYYRIALFVYMLPSERLSGTIVRDQERRGDNARV